MSGQWFELPGPPHRCDLPALYSSDVRVGMGWRCACGRAYVIGEFSQHGASWREWRRATRFDAS